MRVVAPVLIPAVAAGLIWLMAGRLWRRSPAPALSWGGGPALGIALLAGYVALLSWPPFPPVTAVHALVYMTLIAGGVCAFESWWAKRLVPRWTVRTVLLATSAWWQLHPLTQHTWSRTEAAAWLIALIVTALVVWELLEKLASRRKDAGTVLLAWLTACSVSVGLVFGSSAMLGQLAGSIAAACGAAVVLALWARGFPFNGGAAGLLTLILAGLLWQGVFYAELPCWSAAMLLFAPVAAWAGEIPILSAKRPWRARAVGLALPLVILAAGVGIAAFSYVRAAAELGSYEY